MGTLNLTVGALKTAEGQMILHRVVVISRQDEIRQLARRISQQVLIADDIVEAVDIIATVTPDADTS
jgi:hypothetical protein